MAKAMVPVETEAGAAATVAPISEAAEGRLFGSDPTTFEGLGLPEPLVAHLKGPALGYSAPTRVQQMTIPHLLAGRDVMVRAETGSGKTLAYIAPIISTLGNITPRISRAEGTRALVLVPTRELAVQVGRCKLPRPRLEKSGSA